MRFPFRIVSQLSDATRNFEALEARTILDKVPTNFLQLGATAANVSITWGMFTTGTGVIINAGSGDWSLSALATGKATVNFPARAVAPAVLAMVDDGAVLTHVQALSIATSATQIQTTNFVPAAVNAITSFIVIG